MVQAQSFRGTPLHTTPKPASIIFHLVQIILKCEYTYVTLCYIQHQNVPAYCQHMIVKGNFLLCIKQDLSSLECQRVKCPHVLKCVLKLWDLDNANKSFSEQFLQTFGCTVRIGAVFSMVKSQRCTRLPIQNIIALFFF